MSVYPKCANSFMTALLKNNKLFNAFANSKIKHIKPFDVTLRDGLQALTVDEQKSFTTISKKKLYNFIIQNYNPKNIEIGSCVNNKVLPIFNDTEEMFNYCEGTNRQMRNFNHYVLVPNMEHLMTAINIGCKNFSFISSVSNKFQTKNTRMTIEQTEANISEMLLHLDERSNLKFDKNTGDIWKDYTPYNVKLYVSCINECPLTNGKLDNMEIVHTLKRLNSLNVNKICLSDTCGSLEHKDFIAILKMCETVGIDISKFSLHLHVKPERETEVEKIFHTALDYGINEFDLSAVKTGGCSVTMKQSQLAPNMSYEQYYKFLTSYLLKKI